MSNKQVNATTETSLDMDPRQRQTLAAKLHTKHRHAKAMRQTTQSNREQQRVDDKWKEECDKGKDTGKVSLCWLDIQHISQRIYTFKQDYGRDLLHLSLNGIGLPSLEDIPKHCRQLKHLSSVSNMLKDISDIHNLTQLSQLNLLRNQITHLPSTIGELTNLTRLELANNELVQLPPEISNLKGLKHLNLESNDLNELPISFGRLNCEVVNLSFNSFTVCPPCIVDMPKLTQLSIMGNELGCLPNGMHKLTRLQVLRLSKNRITILPDSVVNITSLQCLWLDFNKLSALPPNFYRLSKLNELKMNGNADMVYPSIDTIVKGTEEVLRWSRNRLEMNKSAKAKHIVQSLKEVLVQVKRYRIGGILHESLFEVVDDEFQFPPSALWTVFLPELSKIWTDSTNANEGIKAFPFERHEVEQALFEFRDAAGSIIKKIPNAKFRRCSCIQTGQSTDVCIPSKIGWMCSRPALLVRMTMVYEVNMREKRRILAEEIRIADAERAARNVAKSYLASDEGIIMVREEALIRMEALSGDETRKRPLKKALSASSIALINKISSSIWTQ
jgi:hypothetical protein